MKNFLFGAVALLITLFGVIGIFLLFNDYHPAGALMTPFGPDSIIARAIVAADRLGLDRTGLVPTAELRRHAGLIRQTYDVFGVSAGNERLRQDIGAFWWDVTWRDPEESSLTLGSEGSDREEVQNAAAAMAGRMDMRFDLHGRLVGGRVGIPDTLSLPSLTESDAREKARVALRTSALAHILAAADSSSETKRYVLAGRTDFEFSWRGKDSTFGNALSVTVRVAGDRVASVTLTHTIPERYRQEEDSLSEGIIIVVVFLVLIVAMLVVAVRRIRAGEIGWVNGLIFGIVAAIMYALELFITIFRGLDTRLIFSLLLAPSFFGGVVVLSWSIAEAVGRETWREKFVSLDLLTKGHFLDSRLARSILGGIAAGAVAGFLSLGSAWLAGQFSPVWYSKTESMLRFFSTESPGIYVLVHNVYVQVFLVAGLVLFPLAILCRRFGTTPLLILGWGLVLAFVEKGAINPLIAGLLINGIPYAFFVWILFRFDVVTLYVGLTAASTLGYLPALFNGVPASFTASGNVLLLLFGLAIVLGWVGLMTKDRVSDLGAITPAFAFHISERERLRQELQIARDVQVSLLPKENPRIDGLDVCGRCVPAQEVGGDYYDFVPAGTGRTGVVVGDVSGKGTEGAFYMTLTKGFLKAVTRASNSPATVLTQANSLFYENVERGNFVSMIYALFDLNINEVTIARAGHMPAILHRGGATAVDALQPKGLALGMEPGEVFSSTIEEIRIPFEKNDLLVLYTDGFAEAMNRKGEQFGEDRLHATIASLSGRTAEDVLEGILSEVKSFVGKSVQHDDMTMVVVRRV